MRLLALILLCGILSVIVADPEPKKYKPETKETKNTETKELTEEERKFLREVEAKFGIKSDIPVEKEKLNKEDETDKASDPKDAVKPPFPVVIAFEIVNDTDTNTKDKRTIDANLGYGYRTNNGYTYTYFGKPQEKGKLMFYPYSQDDIPPTRPTHNYNPHKHNKNPHIPTYTRQYSKYTTPSPNVEIQPSQAYELVPVQEEQSVYKSQSNAKTKYSKVKPEEHTAPQYAVDENTNEGHPQTLYTTYNGGQLSGLSSQFPMVMPNYFVDSSQLLHNPQYQNAGLTSDHLHKHGPQQDQRVVPVLVLRVPSSYLRNPSAELYANLPKDYPLSKYLNNVNVQELVNRYFKNIGYPYAPQVMTYQSPIPVPPASYESQQHYAAPQVNPTYTHQDYSGVQYSAVQPVMARYPMPSQIAYTNPQYYMPQPQFTYQQPQQQQQYEYQYVQPTQGYYYPQYEDQQVVYQQSGVQETSPEYAVPQSQLQYVSASQAQAGAQYISSSQAQSEAQYISASQDQSRAQYTQQEQEQIQYEPEKEQETASVSQQTSQKFDYTTYKKIPAIDPGPTKVSFPVYDSPKSPTKGRESPKSSYGPPKSSEYRSKTVSSSYSVPKSSNTAYSAPKTITAAYIGPKTVSTQYGSPNSVSHYGSSQTASSLYGTAKAVASSPEYSAPVASAYTSSHSPSSYYIVPNSEYGSPNPAAEYGAPKTQTYAYDIPKQTSQKESIVYSSPQASYKYIYPESGASRSILYQKYIGEDSQAKSLVISENYPSKDHTQVTVLPHNYKSTKTPVTVQGVNYVTPQPFGTKLHHPFNVMVPQTVLKGEDKVSYINAHSLPSHYAQISGNSEYASEEEYKVPASYIPPVGNQKPPSYPHNHHSIPKRNAKKENEKEKEEKIKDKNEKQDEKKEADKSS